MARISDLVSAYASVALIGMCKNAGKTTVFNQLLREFDARGEALAVTSIGRDGEPKDIVTGTSKPGIYVRAGTLIATAAQLLKQCDITREILATTGIMTPLGEVILLRARSDGNIQLAGPSMNDQLATVSEMFRALGARRVLIDGAVSRKTLCTRRVSEAAILCTGASYHKDIHTVVAHTAYCCEILGTPQLDCAAAAAAFRDFSAGEWKCFSEARQDEAARGVADDRRRPDEAARGAADDKTGSDDPIRPSWKILLGTADGEVTGVSSARELPAALRKKENDGCRYIYFTGALTDALLQPLLLSNAPVKERVLVVADGSKILITPPVYEKLFVKGVVLRVLEPVRLAAVAINPFSAYGYEFDKDELMELMRAHVRVPVVNVGAHGEGA